MRSLRVLLVTLLAIGGCAGETTTADADATTIASSTIGSSTAAPAPSSSSTSASIAVPPGSAPTLVEGPGPHGVETFLPDDPAGAPVAVLVHGGGWVGGLPASTAPLARDLADRGMLVFNASYRTLMNGGAYPAMFDDVACAVRYARDRAAELGATGEVTLVGHSAGAHLVAVTALTDDFFGGDCEWEGSSVPDRWVGLAGIYRLENVAPVMEALFGGPRAELPDVWATADPYLHMEAAALPRAVIIHGLSDQIVPSSSSQDMAFALDQAGQEVSFELIEGANHMDVIDPDVTAALIAP